MTSGSLRASHESRTTYARARLRVGILGVGTWTLLATAALAFDLPGRLLPTTTTWSLADVSGLLGWVLATVAITAPFDLFGGHVLPRQHGRSSRSFGTWLATWLRGVLVHGLVTFGFGLALLATGRWLGDAGALLTVVVGTTALFAGQAWLAPRVAAFGRGRVLPDRVTAVLEEWRVPGPTRVQVFECDDEGFTGGVSGLPGAETHVVPATWVDRFDPRTVAALLARRIALVDRGSRQQGLLMATIWNVAGFALSSLVPGATTTDLAGLATLVAAFTLWSFLGLLVLPSVSRPAVLVGDDAAIEITGERETLARAVRDVDRLLDDEAERDPWVERVFHPIPSVGSRLSSHGSRLRGPAPPWNAARAALFGSWACMNPLARVVHCNVGRPALWVFLPAD